MKQYFADLHVHIGATSEGRPVKITASRKLTFANIVKEALERKGIEILGIVDCACPGVMRDIRELCRQKVLEERGDGGLTHRDQLTVLLGSEVEAVEEDGAVSHHVAYFPFLRQIDEFASVMSRYITNPELSSQRCGLPTAQLLAVVLATGGVMVPAHVFTPHKSVYGKAARRLKDLVGESGLAEIPAVELGLSADTDLADRLGELEFMAFLSNSDAHSLARIAREYNLLELAEPSFREVVLALHGRSGRRVAANFGLDPRLGKYHRTFCESCNRIAQGPPPVLACESCGRADRLLVKGVLDRIVEIADYPAPRHPARRPPYHYQVPLEFVPGVGGKSLERLIAYFGSEMAVLHTASREELTPLVGNAVAGRILLAREGSLPLLAGGGGRYGKVSSPGGEARQLKLV